MPCYNPIRAYQNFSGAPLIFSVSGARVNARCLFVPCGQCIGCRLERCRQWAVRCMHEARLHEKNSFLTLTYAHEFLPPSRSLQPRDFTLFLKRLRARIAPSKILYFMGGEYGSIDGRPHYHAVVFGYYPDDAKYWKTSGSGFKIYVSKELDDIWSKGQVFIGDVSFESASYIARYCLKAEKGVKNTEIVDVETGEIHVRLREYGRMSLRPAIGKKFLDKYGQDIFENDRVIVRGIPAPVPRYYDSVLDKISPLFVAENKAKRASKAELYQSRDAELTDLGFRKRLKVKEAVVKAAISNLKRS